MEKKSDPGLLCDLREQHKMSIDRVAQDALQIWYDYSLLLRRTYDAGFLLDDRLEAGIRAHKRVLAYIEDQHQRQRQKEEDG